MKSINRIISNTTIVTGGLLVLSAFLLPWVQVRFPVGGTVVSGMDLASKDPRLWILPAAALAGAVFNIAACIKYKLVWYILAWTSITAGTAIVFQTHRMIHSQLNTFFIRLISNYSVKPGLYLTAAGFILLAAGAAILFAGKKNTGPAESAALEDR